MKFSSQRGAGLHNVQPLFVEDRKRWWGENGPGRGSKEGGEYVNEEERDVDCGLDREL